ncbi:MAG: SAM-dependent methyltransferase [Proteobacteria bacterium]|nr:SAM-dependent methyltransferase [Pseudomonadota bacterium]
MSAPALYLVPNTLGASDPASVLPAATLAIARSLRHWVVETPKAARAFLGALDVGVPIASLAIAPLGEDPDAATLERLLAPLARGEAIGLVSDAGAPAVADPGARLVAAAHAAGHHVVPLVGPSSILLALMASGLDGQRFAFHGYLPQTPAARATALQRLERESRAAQSTQIFIETPYRNVAMLETLCTTLAPRTRLCVAVDLTLPTEAVVARPVARWRGTDFSSYAKRPAIFLLLA